MTKITNRRNRPLEAQRPRFSRPGGSGAGDLAAAGFAPDLFRNCNSPGDLEE